MRRRIHACGSIGIHAKEEDTCKSYEEVFYVLMLFSSPPPMFPPARPPPGSTGTLVIRVEDRLLCAWLGDTNSQKSVNIAYI